MTSLLKVFDTVMLSDQEWEELVEIDIEREDELFRAFRKYATPEYESMDPTSQTMIRDAVLAACSEVDLYSREIMQRLSLPFSPITNPQLFFTTLREAIAE
ncbi:hypothetical protein DPH57_04910 [Massilia sp. YMA4]|nr:hypothetical protein DPH57_04910 [Massilia sp. YMA4]